MFLLEMRVNGYGYGYLAIQRVRARVKMLVPTRVRTRVRGFFKTARMGTGTIVPSQTLPIIIPKDM